MVSSVLQHLNLIIKKIISIAVKIPKTMIIKAKFTYKHFIKVWPSHILQASEI